MNLQFNGTLITHPNNQKLLQSPSNFSKNGPSLVQANYWTQFEPDSKQSELQSIQNLVKAGQSFTWFPNESIGEYSSPLFDQFKKQLLTEGLPSLHQNKELNQR